jgi:hypothetical protein
MRRPTIRRLMIAIVASALAASLLVHGDGRPGVYLSIGGYDVGAWRSDQQGRMLLPQGRWGGWRYEAGVRDRRGGSEFRLVAWFRDGDAGLVTGDWWALL